MKALARKIKGKFAVIKNYIAVKKMIVSAFLMTCVCDLLTTPVYASGGTSPTAEQKWNTVINFIVPWITRLGGGVILIGAVEFGLAFKNDDAEGKTKGMRTIIAGAIVTAVGLSSDIFLS